MAASKKGRGYIHQAKRIIWGSFGSIALLDGSPVIIVPDGSRKKTIGGGTWKREANTRQALSRK